MCVRLGVWQRGSKQRQQPTINVNACVIRWTVLPPGTNKAAYCFIWIVRCCLQARKILSSSRSSHLSLHASTLFFDTLKLTHIHIFTLSRILSPSHTHTHMLITLALHPHKRLFVVVRDVATMAMPQLCTHGSHAQRCRQGSARLSAVSMPVQMGNFGG